MVAGSFVSGQGQKRFNPMVELLSQKTPVVGPYAPSNRRPGGPGMPGGAGRGAAPAAPAAAAEPAKTPAQLAAEAVGYKNSDFIFDGSMEGNFDRAYPVFTDLMKGMSAAGILLKAPTPHPSHSVVVKMNEIAPDPVTWATRRRSGA